MFLFVSFQNIFVQEVKDERLRIRPQTGYDDGKTSSKRKRTIKKMKKQNRGDGGSAVDLISDDHRPTVEEDTATNVSTNVPTNVSTNVSTTWSPEEMSPGASLVRPPVFRGESEASLPSHFAGKGREEMRLLCGWS